jgi:DNA-directed RNA polymerase sigma subunit (sigma70/sigma32)
MVRTQEMPFAARPVDPKAHKALDEIVALSDAMRAAEAERTKAAVKRAAAIARAREYGMSLDAIAARLGVSRQRVREMQTRAGGK